MLKNKVKTEKLKDLKEELEQEKIGKEGCTFSP